LVHYRPFLNTDPPGLAEVWNDAVSGRGAAYVGSPNLFEYCLFARPWFDPAGLIVAHDASGPVGFAHAGFGPNERETALSTERGVTWAVAVRPTARRQGVGSELLRRSEQYLRERGTRELYFGSQAPLNPFGFGVYGGCNSPGVLDGEPEAGPFLKRHGYAPVRACRVWQRRIDGAINVPDGRFSGLRARYEFRARPRAVLGSWWREATRAPIEPVEFRLEEKSTSKFAASVTAWEMEPFSRTWNEAAYGLLELEVRPDLRRQGLAKLLLTQTFRFLQDQFFSMVEAQTVEGDVAAEGVFRSLGFEAVDVGRLYRKAE
jgi:GNAT superfamily N-acetyltransferase